MYCKLSLCIIISIPLFKIVFPQQTKDQKMSATNKSKSEHVEGLVTPDYIWKVGLTLHYHFQITNILMYSHIFTSYF